jgi:hypothetical protein
MTEHDKIWFDEIERFPLSPGTKERMSAAELGTRMHREIEALMGGYPIDEPVGHAALVREQIEKAHADVRKMTDAAISVLTQRLEPIDFVRDRMPEDRPRYRARSHSYYDRPWFEFIERLFPDAQAEFKDNTYSATKRDPTKHTLVLGDMHASMYASGAKKFSEQLKSYAAGIVRDCDIYGRADVLVLQGGDLLYPPTDHVHDAETNKQLEAYRSFRDYNAHDATIMLDGELHRVDYKWDRAIMSDLWAKLEERALSHLGSDNMSAEQKARLENNLTVDLSKRLELDTMDAMYGNTRAFRGPRVRDWEQRKRKKK